MAARISSTCWNSSGRGCLGSDSGQLQLFAQCLNDLIGKAGNAFANVGVTSSVTGLASGAGRGSDPNRCRPPGSWEGIRDRALPPAAIARAAPSRSPCAADRAALQRAQHRANAARWRSISARRGDRAARRFRKADITGDERKAMQRQGRHGVSDGVALSGPGFGRWMSCSWSWAVKKGRPPARRGISPRMTPISRAHAMSRASKIACAISKRGEEAAWSSGRRRGARAVC